ncbi:retrovirus-related pol polyprotein from transposon TNT 1-94 [Tanacetum coccineum]
MDLMISLGQKNTLAEYMILSGADNRPPMLDKDLYDSWKSRMELYMQNREHGRMILESVEHGPLIWPTIEDNGGKRSKSENKGKDIVKMEIEMESPSVKASANSDVSIHSQCTRWRIITNDVKIYVMGIDLNESSDQQSKTSGDLPRGRLLDKKKTRRTPSCREKMIDSQMDDMLREKLVLKEQIESLEQNLSKQIKEKESLFKTFTFFKNKSKEKEDKYMENEIDLEKKIKELDNIICKAGQSAQTVHMLTKLQAFYDKTHKQDLGYHNPFYLKKAQRIQPTLYDGVVISNTHVAIPVIDDEETLILEEKSRPKMFEKAKDPEVVAKKISHKPIDYGKLNSLINDFGKRFSPQQEFLAERAFWFPILNPTIKPSYTSPVIVDVPSELPKKRTTPSALEEGKWGFEHTKAVFNKEIIPFLKSFKDIFNVFDKDLLNEITEVQIVFDQMEASVQQFSIDKKCLEVAKKEILLENDRLLQKIMSQYVMLTVINSVLWNNDYVNMKTQMCDSCEKCMNLDAELSKSKQAYNDLLKNNSQLEKHCTSLELSMQLKQEVSQNDESCVNQNADTIKSLEKNTKENNVHHEKCDLEPINDELENSVEKLLSENEQLWNEINHVKQVFKDQFDSIKQTRVRHKEQCDSLINKLNLKYVENENLKAQIQDKEIAEQAKAKQPLDDDIDLACKYTTRIQELLVYVQDTCPNAITPSSKKIADTPRNNVKKVRFAEPITSSSKTQQAESSKTSDSNTHVLSSTGVKCFTSNYGSKPQGNKRNDRISQTPSRNKMNKVEAQPRKVVQIVLWYLDSECSKPMTGNRYQLMNFVSKFLGTVRFENDQIVRIMGYGDYQLGNVVISRVYYVEGLGHNLFSIGQFCDADLEVVFRKNTYFIYNLEGVDLLSGSYDTNLYTISLDDMVRSSPICLLSKASKTKSWLWHRRLSHLNFGTLNKLAKDGLARGIPRLKFQKDHLCSACALGKARNPLINPKLKDIPRRKLYLLHMDLCAPMRCGLVLTGEKVSLRIVRRLLKIYLGQILKTKDEAPVAIIKCIKNIQVLLKATVRNVRTDNGTEFVIQKLHEG